MAVAQPNYAPERKPRIANARTARNATQSRIVKNSRERYGGLMRVGAVLAVVLSGLMAYVMLTSNITRLTYAVAHADRQRAHLREQTARLDDKIASMRSDERLAAIARKLGMHEAQTFAVVRLGREPRVAARPFPMLDSIAGWFHGAAAPRVR